MFACTTPKQVICDGRLLRTIAIELAGTTESRTNTPVLIGKRLIVEPFAYDLDTGAKLTEFDLRKRGYGCGTLSASSEALFFRSGNPGQLQLSHEQDRIGQFGKPSGLLDQHDSVFRIVVNSGGKFWMHVQLPHPNLNGLRARCRVVLVNSSFGVVESCSTSRIARNFWQVPQPPLSRVGCMTYSSDSYSSVVACCQQHQ